MIAVMVNSAGVSLLPSQLLSSVMFTMWNRILKHDRFHLHCGRLRALASVRHTISIAQDEQ
jgi:hypothetical protein